MPNTLNEIKTVQDADDTTVILEHENSYFHLNKKIKSFEEISGSKINENKLEIILRLGKQIKSVNMIPDKCVKDKIKIYGVYYGKNNIEENLNKLLIDINCILDKWNSINLNLIEKVIVIKTYIMSKMQHIQQIIEIPQSYINKINTVIFKYLWGGIDKIKRKNNNQYHL